MIPSRRQGENEATGRSWGAPLMLAPLSRTGPCPNGAAERQADRQRERERCSACSGNPPVIVAIFSQAAVEGGDVVGHSRPVAKREISSATFPRSCCWVFCKRDDQRDPVGTLWDREEEIVDRQRRATLRVSVASAAIGEEDLDRLFPSLSWRFRPQERVVSS